MSGRGGIYDGPGGEKLHGDGTPVRSAPEAPTAAPGAKEGLSCSVCHHPSHYPNECGPCSLEGLLCVSAAMCHPAPEPEKLAPGERNLAVFDGFNLAGIADSCGFRCDVRTLAEDWNRLAVEIWRRLPGMLTPPISLPPVTVEARVSNQGEKQEESASEERCPVCGLLLVKREFEMAGCGVCGAKPPISLPPVTVEAKVRRQDFNKRLVICDREGGGTSHLFGISCLNPRLAYPGAGSAEADLECWIDSVSRHPEPIPKAEDYCEFCGHPAHPGKSAFKPPVTVEARHDADAPGGASLESIAKLAAKIGTPSGIIAETSDVALAHSAFKPPVLTEFTPIVHSTLLEMVGFAATGRCMACGWPLKGSVEAGCVRGNCSFRPGEHTPEYQRWWQRTQVLTLARKYVSGELGKSSNAGDVQEAVAGEA